ncbi:MAG TPA: hypothetical protein VFA45_18365 [Actinomycetes bacterium]|jgi:hypothetical protein|nr:hypothetical protein [Actinomycetes bacterium]
MLSQLWFLTDATRRHLAIRVIAAPEAAERLRASQNDAAAAVASGPFGAGLRRTDVKSLLRTATLGYRLSEYSADNAEVVLWAVVVYGNDGGLATQSTWVTSTVRLRWIGDWRLVEITSTPGPVPVQGPDTPSAAADLVREAATLREFADAPA